LGVTLLTGGQPQRGRQPRQRNARLAGLDRGRVHPIRAAGPGHYQPVAPDHDVY
jgi:hypothetical protein